ncbi:MAG: hypothetical protein AAGA96_11805 [Verrucomicrobiota bacterium]
MRFFPLFFRLAGGKIVLAFGVLLATGLIQGAGLMLILPFLHLVGIGEGDSELPPIAESLIGLLERMGISWTIETALSGFVLAVSLLCLLRFWQSVQNATLVRKITAECQTRFYRYWLFVPWIESSRYHGGEILNLIQRDIGQLNQFLNDSLRLFSAGIITLVYCLVAISGSPYRTLSDLDNLVFLHMHAARHL